MLYLFVLDRVYISVEDVLFIKTSLTLIFKLKGSFLFLEWRKQNEDKALVAQCAPITKI